MAGTLRTFARSFGGGEITPEMFGRIDDSKFQTGLAQCENFMVLPHGPVANRPGFQFVREVKDSTKRTRLIPFTFSLTQTVVIEIGEGYFRFHSMGGTVMVGVNPYELANPYLESELFGIRFVQSADVITLTHKNHPVKELRRTGATLWNLIDAVFGSTLAAPAAPTVAATTAGASNLRVYRYVVTAFDAAANESLPSAAGSASNNLNASSTFNTITWAEITGATGYNVYRQEGGLYYLIAVMAGNATVTVNDDNLPHNGGITPPNASDPFAALNYPTAVTYFEQRRAFGGTTAQPQNLWLTRSATEGNFNSSVPPRDADSIQFRIAAREYNQIMHLATLQDLVILTSAGEWRLGSISGALTPTTFAVKPQSYVGSGEAAPLTVNSNLVFTAGRGGHVREMSFVDSAGGYLTGDMSLRAAHLFDGFEIVDTAQTKAPYPVLWFTSTAGYLLGCTYIPEQQVMAWHKHTTAGTFESVTVVAEGGEDALYAVVKRRLGNTDVRFVERMHTRAFATLADAFFVDAGAVYDGVPITTVTAGLTHLENTEVAILADGAVLPNQIVTGGSLTFDQPVSKLSIGLPYNSDFQSLPWAVEMQGMGQGRPKNINQVWLRVFRSSGVFAGPSFDNLTEYKQRTTEPYGSPPALRTGEINISIGPSWQNDGQLCVRQSAPLPLAILSVVMETAVAG